MFPLNATAAPNLVFLRIPCIHLVPHVCQLWPLQNTVQKYCWAILLRILLRKTVAKYSWGIQVVASVCKLQPLHLPRPLLTYSRAGPDYASKLTITVTRTRFLASSATIICNNHHNPHNVTIYVTMWQRIKAHSYRDTNQVFIQFCYYATMWIVYIPTLWVRRLPNLSYWLQAFIMTKSIAAYYDTIIQSFLVLICL